MKVVVVIIILIVIVVIIVFVVNVVGVVENHSTILSRTKFIVKVLKGQWPRRLSQQICSYIPTIYRQMKMHLFTLGNKTTCRKLISLLIFPVSVVLCCVL